MLHIHMQHFGGDVIGFQQTTQTGACLDMFCVLFIINNSFQRYYEKSSIAQIQYCVLPYHITELYLSHLDPILCLCPCEMANFGLSVKIFRAYGSFFGLHSTVVEPLQYYRQLRLALTTYYLYYILSSPPITFLGYNPPRFLSRANLYHLLLLDKTLILSKLSKSLPNQ